METQRTVEDWFMSPDDGCSTTISEQIERERE